jgi:Tol biopolymer transport system component
MYGSVMRIFGSAAAVIALLVTTWAAPAAATLPGANGKLAFERAGDIFVSDADGSNQVNLTNTERRERSAAWSPRGNRIAFISEDAIWVMNADGSRTRLVLEGVAAVSQLSWSPNGEKIAFLRDSRVWTTQSDGSPAKALARTDEAVGGPSWSPDGRRIAFTGLRDNTNTSGDPNAEVYTVKAQGGGLRRLTFKGFGYDAFPDWSPNGRTIVFSRNSGPSTTTVMTVSAAGGGPGTLLYSVPAIFSNAYAPVWAPDGSRVLFTNGDGYFLQTVLPDGSGVTTITQGQEASWQRLAKP